MARVRRVGQLVDVLGPMDAHLDIIFLSITHHDIFNIHMISSQLQPGQHDRNCTIRQYPSANST